jgi:hypothetical protein
MKHRLLLHNQKEMDGIRDEHGVGRGGYSYSLRGSKGIEGYQKRIRG